MYGLIYDDNIVTEFGRILGKRLWINELIK
jgi:hypothetical protein